VTFNYGKTRDLASRQLKAFGRSVTLRRYTIGAYNAELGVAAQTSADETRTGVLLEFGFSQTRGPGGLIQGGDRRMLMDADAAAPNLEDHVVVGTEVYVIKGISETNPAGTPVLYDLHLRA